MSGSVWLAILWVFVGVITAMQPMRRQYVPGVSLLLSAPVLLWYIGVQHGWIPVVLALLAFVSMMRNPLRYLLARLRGERPELPE